MTFPVTLSDLSDPHRTRVKCLSSSENDREYVLNASTRSPNFSRSTPRPLFRMLTSSFLTAKQCYHCQGLGHVQADCPTLRINGAATSGRCYSCGQPGHLARNCPASMGQRYQTGFNGRGPMRGFASSPRPATCYKCGGPNHYARDCQAQAMKCYACGKLGHISRDCTAPNGGPLSTAGKTCYRCGEPGHISRDCPQNIAPNSDSQAPVVTSTTTVPPVEASAPAAEPAPNN
ncbi:hypothetical protein Dda_0540 [Drechslerella dactyloides]|uniref:CCHC-type domain-containing protein n=1 Tax=Drechslerella dactyloides TaxID=74499 RepID=A0AAD6J6I4_DREDA|nr:hypothetical protein Dda_0540 [Drechslerella dactyloides]